jgi:hypothetical protein
VKKSWDLIKVQIKGYCENLVITTAGVPVAIRVESARANNGWNIPTW